MDLENFNLEITKAMFPKEVWDHRDKVMSGSIIPEYVKIQKKKSELGRNKRDEIARKFEYYKSKGLYSDKDLDKIQRLINNETP